MAQFNVVDVYTLHLINGQHSLNVDQLAVFLTNAAPASPTNISDLTAATNSANITNKNITTTSTSQTSGVASLALADKLMTADGGPVGPFQYVYIYNTVNGHLLGYYDYGSPQNLVLNQEFLVDFTNANNYLFSITAV